MMCDAIVWVLIFCHTPPLRFTFTYSMLLQHWPNIPVMAVTGNSLKAASYILLLIGPFFHLVFSLSLALGWTSYSMQ